MNSQSSISLSELAHAIEQGIQSALPNTYWVVAEISELSVNSKGHCYLELIEKPEHHDMVTAKLRATIWSYKYQLIHSYFYASTGLHLQAGLKVLVCAKVEFHAVYGLSLSIIDIDPVYTIGEDEKHRNAIIRQLHDEGVFSMNKDSALPLFAQRIAIVSSVKAAGYQDFVHQIAHNKYCLNFSLTLFNATMQGAETEQSIVQALDAIYERESEFDAVVIIRGGGSKTDLRWFDNYAIAAHIAQFPLPVITGIGHDKDISISDMVAHTSVKTPTAAAELFISMGEELLFEFEDIYAQVTDACTKTIAAKKQEIQQSLQKIVHAYSMRTKLAESDLQYCSQKVSNAVAQYVQKKQGVLQRAGVHIASATYRLTQQQSHVLSHASYKLAVGSTHLIAVCKQHIELFQTKVTLHNPTHILSKGYSITTNAEGKLIQSIHDIAANETMLTQVSDGVIQSTVRSKN